ncbi:hypothetical protein BHE97_02840 [Aeromicrobium sp. PE09-221]|uniref:GNAT family N-acetyltransferase n=1 Tax=Aeromicrobium sp. PE09-221 TaxID=1898043 RepID=UPI000B3EAD97|nr:GNAT family protein [Aeromicrobium sp. PE09-221]OUZ12145.1 hypothetical protein BHE97_02840 [Aeromicrobium sp. PE09-221]
MTFPVALQDGVVLRVLEPDDVSSLAAALLRNRDHLAPWEPQRSPEYYTSDGQLDRIERMLAGMAQGTQVPLVLSQDDHVVGTVSVNDIVRGAFQNGHIGYWMDARFQSRGLMTAAVRQVVRFARDSLGLHRLQAGTLRENIRSQRVLERNGFVRFGLAPEYLRIAGRWQDHVLYQRILPL